MKRSIWKSRMLNPLGWAVALATVPGIAMAQSNPSPSTTEANLSLMSGNAELVHSINSRSAMKGQAVAAKLTSSIETPQGIKLPGGTELMGRVENVQASAKDGSSTLALTFNQAQLKNGKIVPIKATVVGIAPDGSDPGAPAAVGPEATFHQDPGVVGNIALDSAVNNSVSGTLTNAHHDIKLNQGTQLMVAVGIEPTQQQAEGAR